MRRIGEILNEDTNQFGPGTDLVVSILAVLLVLSLVSSYSYAQKQQELLSASALAAQLAARGDFRLAAESFPAGTFHANPATSLISPPDTDRRIRSIVADYRLSSGDFPYIFVIGHANQLDDSSAADQSRAGRLVRNWEFGTRRAAVIAARLESHLTGEEHDRLVVMTTGEFDMRSPGQPLSQENAWVEVVFGRAWKPPSHSSR